MGLLITSRLNTRTVRKNLSYNLIDCCPIQSKNTKYLATATQVDGCFQHSFFFCDIRHLHLSHYVKKNSRALVIPKKRIYLAFDFFIYRPHASDTHEQNLKSKNSLSLSFVHCTHYRMSMYAYSLLPSLLLLPN